MPQPSLQHLHEQLQLLTQQAEALKSSVSYSSSQYTDMIEQKTVLEEELQRGRRLFAEGQDRLDKDRQEREEMEKERRRVLKEAGIQIGEEGYTLYQATTRRRRSS